MSVPKTLWIAAALLLGAAAVSGAAETRYVSDVLVINLRAAPAPGAETLAHLRTGDEFEVLETRGEFLRVRTPAGKEGWVTRQYTTAETPKARVIASLRQKLGQAERRAAETAEEAARLKQQLSQATEEHTAASRAVGEELAAARREAKENARRYREVKKQFDELSDKSKRVLEITAERDALREQNSELQAKAQQLDAELQSVTRSNLVTGLLVGGGLVLAGWVLGSTSRKKKSRYSVG